MALTKKSANKKVPTEKVISIPKSVELHYIKTGSYRSYHVDGVFGGVTPNRKLYIEFFIQRQVTPKVVEHKVNDDGTVGEEIRRESKKGLVREIEAGIVMDIEIAKSLKEWLDEKIKKVEESTVTTQAKGKSKKA
jgi:hypothetical protein